MNAIKTPCADFDGDEINVMPHPFHYRLYAYRTKRGPRRIKTVRVKKAIVGKLVRLATDQMAIRMRSMDKPGAVS